MIDPPFRRPPPESPEGDTRIYLVGVEDRTLDEALRRQGHVLERVAPSALSERISEHLPNLVIVDLTTSGVRDCASELSESLAGKPVSVFLILDEVQASDGEASDDEVSNRAASDDEVSDRAASDDEVSDRATSDDEVSDRATSDDELRKLAREVAFRPLDVDAIADRITSLTRHRTGVTAAPPPPSSRPSSIPETIGLFDGEGMIFQTDGLPPAPLLSYPPAGQTSNPPGASSAPPGSWPSTAPQPLGTGLNTGAFAGPTSVSEELEKLLAEAERRVMSEANAVPDVPSPEAEVNAILPPEVLAALDDPLEVADDEELSGGAESQTPVGRGTSGGYAGGDGVSKLRVGTDAGDVIPAEPVTAHGHGDHPPTTGVADSQATPVPEQAELSEPRGPMVEMTSRKSLGPSTTSGVGSVVSWQREDGLRAPSGLPTPIPSSADYPPRAKVPESMPTSSIPRTTAASHDEQGILSPLRSGAPQPIPQSMPMPQSMPQSMPQPKPQPMPGSMDPGPGIPEVLTPEYDGLRVIGVCIASRVTSTLCFEYEGVLCRAVMRDGDFVTCGSSADDESLLSFLMLRGDLPREVGNQLVGRVPPFGRHAAAALIANGFLGQDQLWLVLRSHAEWLLGRMASTQGGTCALEPEPPGRLRAEPGVFGGATGAEVLVEVTQRVMPYEDAVNRLGGLDARLALGLKVALLSECALTERERGVVDGCAGHTVHEVIEAAGEAEFAAVLVALQELGVIEVMATIGKPRQPEPSAFDPLDAEAVRKRIAARLAIIQEGDYFEVLGVSRTATAYEIRRAYLESRRSFEPAHILTAQTVDLADDARLIVEVLDEAYEVLRDGTRRERYRRALEAVPPRI